MFDLELTWDRPAKLNFQQANHGDSNHVAIAYLLIVITIKIRT
jgi:hypothetical protein